MIKVLEVDDAPALIERVYDGERHDKFGIDNTNNTSVGFYSSTSHLALSSNNIKISRDNHEYVFTQPDNNVQLTPCSHREEKDKHKLNPHRQPVNGGFILQC